jgi:hypothetical protein
MDTEEALKSWRTLRTACGPAATVQQLEALLKAEQAGENRPNFLIKIHGRLSKLKTEQERAELLRSV